MERRRRLEELERAMGATSITLTMGDGSVRQVAGGRLYAMVGELGAGIVKPDTQDVIESIHDNGLEQGGGRLCEVIRAFGVGDAQLSAMTPEELAALDASEGEDGSGPTIQ